ncbi:anaerobic carbon-monoxide dehydrogenase catalytic subunit [Thermosediminibacter oceani]|uniref:Carbon monoxide dehydrogenase n=1 Tax=Thermosediminibacter oceani (strain ATCC BAA-1034 / DSM 16646 / JW/IW-1228P) TaxID=555079 RepID=D9S0V2_THEOJ|nr:anaerobic carbon-monoxide dehydrogenase catalytic subunit [Thermosediminibacter oceani]ADL07116.1 carbon-monoxide dehydrogenase, catalytic subunit [Thermosediminibacter oceani DSM 16646]
MEMCTSADKKLIDFMRSKFEVETSFNRVSSQAVKCGFGMQGVCCRLCTNGPCRITPQSPKGVCGATADTIVARNFLRSVAAGAACYLHILENTAKNLRALGQGKNGLTIKGPETLRELAEMFEIEETDPAQQAVKIAERVLEDLYLPREQQMTLVEKLAYRSRFQRWKELNILPGGAKSEVFDAIVKTSTNLSSDPVDMLLHALKLGIATGLYGLTLTNYLNDIMLGEPQITTAKVGFSVVDPDYINIMVTGHQHSLIGVLQDKIVTPEADALASKNGAKGFKIVGCTCVGQDMQQRGAHYRKAFAGHVGNNFTSEALLATGGIDLVVSDFNCTVPGIETICEQFQVAQICLDDVAKKSNADFIRFDSSEAADIAEKIMHAALESYTRRRGKVQVDIPDHGCDDAVTGLSKKSLKSFLGGNFKPLIDLIASGKIRGVAAVVGCSNLTAKGHDVFTVELTKELIKRDIIVLSAGCTSGGLENVGLTSPGAAELAGDNLKEVCRTLGIPPVLNFGPCLAIGRLETVAAELAQALDIDIPELPLVLSAPQWLEEQALADASFGLALGLPIHVAIPPFVTGSQLVSKVLTEDVEQLTGGKVIVEGEIVPAAEKLADIIEQKRKALLS